MADLKGKRILITGGSRGIGAGIAHKLAEAGARLAITYTSRPDAAEQVLKSLPGDGHMSLKMDVGDEASVNEGIQNVINAFDQIDGVVNNAGITRDQLLLRMKTDDFDDVMQTNLRGTFLVTKAVMKSLLKARQYYQRDWPLGKPWSGKLCRFESWH